MLLPSAIGCDSSSQTTHKPRLQASLFASPPLSPPPSSGPRLNNLYSTCRALQSMLTTPNQLPSPPTTHAEVPASLAAASPSPFKLRLRARKTDDSPLALAPRKKIAKRGPPPRGINKRRRAADDDVGRGRAQQEDDDGDDVSAVAGEEEEDDENGPRTPKRARLLAPPVLPLGLERGDFHSLLPPSSPRENEVRESIEESEKQR
ncbi:hypothetical protein LAWI1_G006947, partial [Lachnellula willkommii]